MPGRMLQYPGTKTQKKMGRPRDTEGIKAAREYRKKFPKASYGELATLISRKLNRTIYRRTVERWLKLYTDTL